MKEAKADYLCEVSWEVCNKVGGIYTVVKSKARQTALQYRKNYVLIGPYIPKNAEVDFEETPPPSFLKAIFEKLKAEGIICYYGLFDSVNAILIDFSEYAKNKNAIKAKIWDMFKVDSLDAPYDFDEPLIWSWCAGRLIEEISSSLKNKKIVAQCHEWLAGGTVLYLKSVNSNVATVFTTHATTLGRTMTGNGRALYEELHGLNTDAEAKKYGVMAKHSIEKAVANNCDVFTTVSQITSFEALAILGRKADVLLPNGLNLDHYPTFEEASIRHGINKVRLKSFANYFFSPHYAIDLENTLFFFLSGRYELRNKGIDVFIKALGKLNQKMKSEKSKKTVITFFWVPGNIKAIKLPLLESKILYSDIEDFVDMNTERIKQNIVSAIISKKLLHQAMIFEKDFIDEAKRRGIGFVKGGMPLLVTHDLYNENSDPVLNAFRAEGLLNREEDKVKVVFYPSYLTGTEGLLDMGYNDAISGCHLGVFPSYYEPWGYTPLESAAMGVPAVTDDLSGFGMYLKGESCLGLCVLKRYGISDEVFIGSLFNHLDKFVNLSQKERVRLKMEAKKLSAMADWNMLIDYYIEAHNLAIEKRR
ncbi:MAG: glycogen/starch synthase [Candidatus Woesearchaeota archaeon]